MASGNPDAVATEFCSNCKRDIPAINYLMHQNHCSRNIVLCSQCQEPVPRSEMDEHKEEYHVEVICKCGQAVEKWIQEEHDAENCPQRQVKCDYCEMDMDFKDLAEHTDFCGSRTDACPLCSRYIFFRDRAQHEASNCTYPEAKQVIKPSIQADQWRRNQLLHRPAEVKQFPTGLPGQFAFPTIPNAREDAEEQRRNMDARSIADVMSADRKHRKNQDRVQNVMAQNPTRPREKNEERALLQSTVNQEELDHRLAQHLAQDLPYKTSFNPDVSLDDTYPNYSLPPYTDYHDDFTLQQILKESVNIPGVNTFQVDSTPAEEVILPCEFCQQMIPAGNLIQHQSGCRPDLTCLQVSGPGRANNSRERRGNPPQQPAEVLNNLSHQQTFAPTLPGYNSVGRAESPVTYDDDNLLMLPCEFCEVLLPVDALPMHQVNCIENGTVTPTPAIFDVDPGQHHTRQDRAVESPVRPLPHRVHRPQDFGMSRKSKKYQEEHAIVDPSIDDDDSEVDTIPVRMVKSTIMSRTNQQPAFTHSASDKYFHATSWKSQAKPTATVTTLSSDGDLHKPKAKNTAAQTRYHEDRPQSKSNVRVRETLQRLNDVPVISSDEERNNLVGTRLSSGLGADQEPQQQMNNSSQYKSKKPNKPQSGFYQDDQTSLPAQFHLPSAKGKPPRQSSSGARQKVLKPRSTHRGATQHSDGYTPSFSVGGNPRKSRDIDRQDMVGGMHKSKQTSVSNTKILDHDGLNQPLQVKGESSTHGALNPKTAQRAPKPKPAQRRRPAAPKNPDDPFL